MGGAAKILNLLSTPFPLLHSRPVTVNLSRYTQLAVTSFQIHHYRRSLSFFPPRAGNSRFRIREFHGSSSFGESASATVSGSDAVRISLPEWGRLIDCFSGSLRKSGEEGGVDSGDDSFSGFEKLPSEFLASAEICLKFARERPESLRLLTKKDVDLVVENGSPFLFKHALNSSRRMRAFVNSTNCSVLDNETERAETVDLMRYLLGYVYNKFFYPRAYTRATKVFEESVHDLFKQLVNITETTQPTKFTEMHNQSSTGFQQPNFSETNTQSSTGFQQSNFAEKYNQFSTGFQQSPLPSGQNIEMKRGDWTCSNCKFMNFAKNAECLECQMSRPKRQLTGGEWECPQCDFFNYGRNAACLKCDCKRPLSPFIGGISTIINENKTEIKHKLSENDEKSERWFNKASQISDTDMFNLNNVINDKDFPEIMPLREDSGRYVSDSRMLQKGSAHNQNKRNASDNDGSRIVGKNSSISKPLECLDSIIDEQKKPQERLINDQYTRNTGDNNGVKIEGKVSSISKTLDRILSQQSTLDTKGKVGSQPGRSDPHSLPFVPLPADMFRKPQIDNCQQQPSAIPNSSLKSDKWVNSSSSRISETGKSINNQIEAVDEEGFPDIMPMRKGENRFVVSKKKDRSLTSSSSPQYKKRFAMDQSITSNFVPFVPFPPDYFAKKNGNPTSKSESEVTESIQRSPEFFSEIKSDANNVDQNINSPMSGSSSWNSGSSYSWNNRSSPSFSEIPSNNISQVQNSNIPPPWNSDKGNSSGSGPSIANSSAPSSWNKNTDIPRNDFAHTSNSQGTYFKHRSNVSLNASSSINYNRANHSSQSSEKSVNSGDGGFTGKSLEGSAVTDPDPLDMSEEAKAQRWFRRVAQIKDISELSNIPDEDFPEIMPMRKGVNRFVVSKRKTPLERRLTSPQYRRNLPIVSSDHDNNSSNKHGGS